MTESIIDIISENHRLKESLGRAQTHIITLTADRDAERKRREEMASAIVEYIRSIGQIA